MAPTKQQSNKITFKDNKTSTRKEESERQLSRNKTTRRDVANFERGISKDDYVFNPDPVVSAFLNSSFDDPGYIL
jgi:hypothetical protein